MHVVEVVIDVSIREHECDNLLPCVGLQILRRPNGHFRLVCLLPRPRATRSQLIPCRDETFNSITGLNGSGKSNILDAICFVLGITNMSTVRAQNLQVRRAESTLVGGADQSI